jgi:AcrR family transcriptional regulator
MRQIFSGDEKTISEMDIGTTKRAPGRPRSEEARRAILRSTMRLLEHTGFSDLSIEAIAADANVGKTTVYRWWSNKGALVADAFVSNAAKQLRFPNTGSVRADIRLQMNQWITILRGRRGRIVAALISGGQSDKEIIEAFRERFVRPKRLDAYQILRRGMDRGELSMDVDMDLLLDSLYGAIYMRFLIWQDGLNEQFVNDSVELIFSGAATRQPLDQGGRNGSGKPRARKTNGGGDQR